MEELKEWKSKFEERIALLETKIRKMERELDDTATTISSLHNAKTNFMLEISKLQTEAEVNLTKLRHNLMSSVPFGLTFYLFKHRLICC